MYEPNKRYASPIGLEKDVAARETYTARQSALEKLLGEPKIGYNVWKGP